MLGIYLSYNEEACYKYNLESKINQAKHFTNLWSMRNLTLYGGTQIIKTFIISEFLCALSHSHPTDGV